MVDIYLALVFVLEVIETIATFTLTTRLKVSQEVIIGGVTTSHLLHRDELLILDEEDAVAVAEHKKIFHLKIIFPLSDSPLGVILLFEDSLYGRMKHDTNVLRFVGLFCGVTSSSTSSSSEATITKAAHSAHTVAGV